MAKSSIVVVAVAVIAGGAGVAVGRVTAHHTAQPQTTTTGSAAASATAPSAGSAAPVAVAPAIKTHAAFIEAMQSAERAAPQAEMSLPSCVQQLRIVRQLVKDDEAMRVDEQGTAIPARSTPSAPRFSTASLTGALQAAFSSTKVPGNVDGVDCAEYPCIVFGRIRGAEDQMPKLEHAKSMAAYEDDILTVLLWSGTDEEAKEAAEARHEADEGLEQSLFAIALYPRADKEQLGDNLDRRIRSRTAELWNGMSPSDETNAHP